MPQSPLIPCVSRISDGSLRHIFNFPSIFVPVSDLRKAPLVPIAYCWVCRTDVVVWRDFSADLRTEVPRCTHCDQQLDQWGVDPGIRQQPLSVLDSMGLMLLDRSAGQACSSGGGCGEGAGCASTGGGGGCYVPASNGRAGVMAAEGKKGCGSCGIKRECADQRRDSRRQSALLAVIN